MLTTTKQDVTSLYCLICESLVRKPVALPCCGDAAHAYCCAACIKVGDACPLCDSVIREDALRFMRDVGVASESVPCRCANEGCEVILPSYEISQHTTGACPFFVMSCSNSEEGCEYVGIRRDMGGHLHTDCLYRIVSCPQRCGASIPVQTLDDHIADVCLKTLVDCPNSCGQTVERGLVSDHESVCDVRPLSCPYARYGCTLRGSLTRDQLGQHMAASIHAHLLLIDSYTSAHALQVASALASVTRRPLHVWDPGYIQVIDRWPAQESTIRAMTILGEWIVTGCDKGSLRVIDVNTGAHVRTLEGAGSCPVSALSATSDGRLVAAFTDCSLQVWESSPTEPLKHKAVSQRIHLSSQGLRGSRVGVVLAMVGVSKAVHIGPERRHLLHTELYAVPPMTASSALDGNVLDCLAVGCGGEVFILTLSTLEQVIRLSLVDLLPEAGVVVAPVVSSIATVSLRGTIGGAADTILVGTSSGYLIAIDLSTKALPHRILLRPFGEGEGISALWAGLSSGPTPSWVVALGGSMGGILLGRLDGECAFETQLLAQNAHKGPVRSLCCADGKHVVSGAEDETTMVWSAAHQLPVREMPNSLYCAATAHRLVFGAGTQGSVRIITATTCRTEGY